MDIVADIILAAAAFGAGLYCLVLAKRLNRLNNLEKGVGGAVAVLSSQVADLQKTLEAAQTTASQSADTLTALTSRAADVSKQLELQMASLHDLPAAPVEAAQAQAETQKPAEPLFKRHSNGKG
ncbi:MAG: hypothetical protein AAFY74_19240 [Pseudomonadota bacterium]